MRSLSDYIDDFLYDRKLRKNSSAYGYTVHDAKEARGKLDRCRKERDELIAEQNFFQSRADRLNEIRNRLDPEIDRAYDEYMQKNGDKGGYTREAFETDEYRKLMGELQPIEQKLLDIDSKLSELKEEIRNAENVRSFEDYKKDFEGKQYKPLIVLGCFILNGIHIIKEAICFAMMLFTLHKGYLNDNPFYLIFWSVFPIAVFVWSTCYASWRFENRKYAALNLVIIEELMHIASLLARLVFYPLFAFLFLSPHLTFAFKEADAVWYMRGFIFLFTAVIIAVTFFIIENYITRIEVKEQILYFKYSRGKDYRKDKEYKYDLRITRNLKTSQTFLIKENDRFLHMFFSGATGTGKTSSGLMQMIRSDLDQIVRNMNAQKEIVLGWLKEGRIKKLIAFSDSDFNLSFFAPADDLDREEKEAVRKELDDLRERIPIAGQMVCAPNEGMADDAYELAEARGMKRIYRIDPIRTPSGGRKKGWTGFNPIYISPLITGPARVDEITVRATIVKDILNNLQKASGKTDAYFEGVNSIQTTTISVLLMLTYSYVNRTEKQPTLIDVQNLINDYSEIRPYYFALIRLYGNNGQPMPETAPFIDSIDPFHIDRSMDAKKYSDATARFFKENKIYCGAWQHIFVTLRDTIMHPTEGPVIYDRSRGLRDQYNLFLSDQRIRDIYEAENVMDLDDVLLHGGIIIVNYALELGQETSAAFGIFFLIMYSKAVLRRNIHSYLIPFFTYIDEFPTLINKNLEELFSLHRQYRSANTVAFQTLSQMDRTEETRYFKEVLISNCAHKVIFGRVTPDEMKLYEEMSGMVFESLDQATVSETSLFSDEPRISYSHRATPKRVAAMEGSSILYRDFQEGTVYSVCDGEPLRPFHVKMDFLLNVEKKSPPQIEGNWDDYPPYQGIVGIGMQPVTDNTHTYGRTQLESLLGGAYRAYAAEPLAEDGSDCEFRFGSGRPSPAAPQAGSMPQFQQGDPHINGSGRAARPSDAVDRFFNS